MRRRKTTAVYKDESKVFYLALSSCIVVLCSYMYFVSMSVVDVVMRKEVDKEIASLGTKVSQLESAYIEMQHSVSREIATREGYVVADKKIFIDRTEDTLVFSGN